MRQTELNSADIKPSQACILILYKLNLKRKIIRQQHQRNKEISYSSC